MFPLLDLLPLQSKIPDLRCIVEILDSSLRHATLTWSNEGLRSWPRQKGGGDTGVDAQVYRGIAPKHPRSMTKPRILKRTGVSYARVIHMITEERGIFSATLEVDPGTSAGVPSQKETRAPRDRYWTARDNDIWVLLLTAAADSVYTKRKANSWGFKPIYLIA